MFQVEKAIEHLEFLFLVGNILTPIKSPYPKWQRSWEKWKGQGWEMRRCVRSYRGVTNLHKGVSNSCWTFTLCTEDQCLRINLVFLRTNVWWSQGKTWKNRFYKKLSLKNQLISFNKGISIAVSHNDPLLSQLGWIRIIVNFDEIITFTLGTIKLLVMIPTATVMTNLAIMNISSHYNMILERPWVYKMKVVASSFHQTSKYHLTSEGLIEIKG